MVGGGGVPKNVTLFSDCILCDRVWQRGGGGLKMVIFVWRHLWMAPKSNKSKKQIFGGLPIMKTFKNAFFHAVPKFLPF